ncbi:MAG: LacI family DNA-binding transcriptional regulator [Terriglobia bacterium]
MITIRDVAKTSGYSVTTVSMVLNDAPLARHIPDKTKTHVKQIAEDLGYRPNPFARALRSQRSHSVGVMVPDIADPYCAQILRGIEGRLVRSGHLAILTDIQNNRTRFKRQLGVLLERRVEGLIILANSLYFETELLQGLEKWKVPSVILGRQLERSPLNWVATDNEAGTHMALQHLYKLGHRKIAFIRGPKMIVDSAYQWKGISSFAADAGLELNPRLVVPLKTPFSTYEGGYALTKELLGRGAPFTALVAFDDMTAFGAIRALTSSRLKVPEDCSVVGFDDLPVAAFYNPSLTSVREGMEALGSLGGQILAEAIAAARMKNKFSPVHRKVKPEFVVRESTAAPRY